MATSETGLLRRASFGLWMLVSPLASCAPQAAHTDVASPPAAQAADSATPAAPVTTPTDRDQHLYVASAEVDCSTTGRQTCLRVKSSPQEDFQTFYANIEGFEFVPGYEYSLRVEVTQRENVPADASSLRYRLLDILDAQPSGLSLSSAWAPKDAEMGSRMTVKFEPGRLVGSGGINQFHATLEVEGTRLNIGPMGVTRRAGPASLMQKEEDFLERLAKVGRYRIVGDELRLLDANSRVILVLKHAES